MSELCASTYEPNRLYIRPHVSLHYPLPYLSTMRPGATVRMFICSPHHRCLDTNLDYLFRVPYVLPGSMVGLHPKTTTCSSLIQFRPHPPMSLDHIRSSIHTRELRKSASGMRRLFPHEGEGFKSVLSCIEGTYRPLGLE